MRFPPPLLLYQVDWYSSLHSIAMTREQAMLVSVVRIFFLLELSTLLDKHHALRKYGGAQEEGDETGAQVVGEKPEKRPNDAKRNRVSADIASLTHTAKILHIFSTSTRAITRVTHLNSVLNLKQTVEIFFALSVGLVMGHKVLES